jgi:hypothetical protein
VAEIYHLPDSPRSCKHIFSTWKFSAEPISVNQLVPRDFAHTSSFAHR